MYIGQKTDSVVDLSRDINAQLCALAKFAKPESACVANPIRIIANSCHRKNQS